MGLTKKRKLSFNINYSPLTVKKNRLNQPGFLCPYTQTICHCERLPVTISAKTFYKQALNKHPNPVG